MIIIIFSVANLKANSHYVNSCRNTIYDSGLHLLVVTMKMRSINFTNNRTLIRETRPALP